MTDGLTENKDLPKIKGKFKIPKGLIVILSILLLIGVAGVVLWKMGIVAKMLTPRPGSCLILTEENCKKVEIIKSGNGQVAVVNLPKGAIVFSPVAGTYNNRIQIKTDGKHDFDWGYTIIGSNVNTTYNFLLSKENKLLLPDLGKPVSKDVQIAAINDTKELNNFNYNFVFFVSKKFSDGKYGPDVDSLYKIINKK